MSEETKLSIALLINNTVRIIGFIALAIFFKKWWICLLAVLFLAERRG